jgi:hypothetical protein
MGPLLAFTLVMWSTARCYSDSSCGYGVLWGLLSTPSFFPGHGLWFHPRGLLYISGILPMYIFMGDFSKTINLKKKKKKKLLCAFLCLSLGLKKPEDFTNNNSLFWCLILFRFVHVFINLFNLICYK